MSNSPGFITSLELLKNDGGKTYFPKNMENLNWKDIKKLSVLTGKNGYDKFHHNFSYSITQ